MGYSGNVEPQYIVPTAVAARAEPGGTNQAMLPLFLWLPMPLPVASHAFSWLPVPALHAPHASATTTFRHPCDALAHHLVGSAACGCAMPCACTASWRLCVFCSPYDLQKRSPLVDTWTLGGLFPSSAVALLTFRTLPVCAQEGLTDLDFYIGNEAMNHSSTHQVGHRVGCCVPWTEARLRGLHGVEGRSFSARLPAMIISSTRSSATLRLPWLILARVPHPPRIDRELGQHGAPLAALLLRLPSL